MPKWLSLLTVLVTVGGMPLTAHADRCDTEHVELIDLFDPSGAPSRHETDRALTLDLRSILVEPKRANADLPEQFPAPWRNVSGRPTLQHVQLPTRGYGAGRYDVITFGGPLPVCSLLGGIDEAFAHEQRDEPFKNIYLMFLGEHGQSFAATDIVEVRLARSIGEEEAREFYGMIIKRLKAAGLPAAQADPFMRDNTQWYAVRAEKGVSSLRVAQFIKSFAGTPHSPYENAAHWVSEVAVRYWGPIRESAVFDASLARQTGDSFLRFSADEVPTLNMLEERGLFYLIEGDLLLPMPRMSLPLEKGARGDDVVSLQRLLISFNAGDAARRLAASETSMGIFDQATLDALDEYRFVNGRETTSERFDSDDRFLMATHMVPYYELVTSPSDFANDLASTMGRSNSVNVLAERCGKSSKVMIDGAGDAWQTVQLYCPFTAFEQKKYHIGAMTVQLRHGDTNMTVRHPMPRLLNFVVPQVRVEGEEGIYHPDGQLYAPYLTALEAETSASTSAEQMEVASSYPRTNAWMTQTGNFVGEALVGPTVQAFEEARSDPGSYLSRHAPAVVYYAFWLLVGVLLLSVLYAARRPLSSFLGRAWMMFRAWYAGSAGDADTGLRLFYRALTGRSADNLLPTMLAKQEGIALPSREDLHTPGTLSRMSATELVVVAMVYANDRTLFERSRQAVLGALAGRLFGTSSAVQT